MEHRARAGVDEIRCTSVSDLRLGSVGAADLRAGVAAVYRYRDRSITVDRDLPYGDDRFLGVLGHEIVHAMFHQLEAHRYYATPVYESFQLKEETAADVLGAHIAGMVWSNRGGDGDALTMMLVEDIRNDADSGNPRSYYQWIDRVRATYGINAMDEDREHSIFIHVSSPKMVDDMDRICRENPRAWDAARAIQEEYLTWGEVEEARWVETED